MVIQEWSLIIFTIFAQMAVGSFVVLGVIHYFTVKKAGMEAADELSDRALLAIGPVLALGLLASIFHLGNPVDAPTAIMNISSSWLSREIFFGVLFGVLSFIFAFSQWRKSGTFAMRNIIAWIAALVGLALVYSMSRVYMIKTQPAWNTLATPVLFFVTSFLLGSLAIGVTFVADYSFKHRKDPENAQTLGKLMRNAIHWISIASIILLGIELVTIAIYNLSLAGSSIPEAVSSAALTYNQFGWMFALRVILVFLGAGVFTLFLYRKAIDSGNEKVIGYLVLGAFVLVLVAEIMGRFLFYATQVPIGA